MGRGEVGGCVCVWGGGGGGSRGARGNEGKFKETVVAENGM